jgi:hypothetical protein
LSTIPTPETVEAPRRAGAAGAVTWLVVLLLGTGFYYNWYRYPFRINDPGTSPTYGSTPLWVSLAKYLLILGLLIAAVLLRGTRFQPITIRRPLLLPIYAYLALAPVLAGIWSESAEMVVLGFFFLVPVVLHVCGDQVFDVRRANRFLGATLVVLLAVQFLQLLLFVTVGRLPALAHHDSLAVRFGSVLDDPNAFAIVVSWLLPFSWVRFTGFRRAAAVSLLLVALVLTQSLTGLAALIGAGAVTCLLFLTHRPRYLAAALAAWLLLAAGATVLAVRFADEIRALFWAYMTFKEGSIVEHGDALKILDEIRVTSALGLEPLPHLWGETGYINLLAYFGVPYLLVLLALGGWMITHYARIAIARESDGEARAFAFGAVGLLVAVFVGNLGLPLFEVYPINLFAVILLGLGTAGLVELDGAAQQDALHRRPETLQEIS